MTENGALAGLLGVASTAYLISISRRQQVAQIKGSPIYVITGVSFIPLSSQSDAKNAILQARQSLKQAPGAQRSEGADESESSEDEDFHLTSPTEPKSAETPSSAEKGSSVAEDVIGRKGQYGRFAERWFSRVGWRGRAQARSTEDRARTKHDAAPSEGTRAADRKPSVVEGERNDATTSKEETERDKPKVYTKPLEASASEHMANTLLPKLLRTTKVLLTSGSFFFSYDYDVTRRFGSQETPSREVPLHRSVDPLVRSLSKSDFHRCEAQAHVSRSSFGTIIWQRTS